METIRVEISRDRAKTELLNKMSKDPTFRGWIVDMLEYSGDLDFVLECLYGGLRKPKWEIGTELMFDTTKVVLMAFNDASKYSPYTVKEVDGDKEHKLGYYSLTEV